MTADVRDRAATAGLEFIYLERAGAPAIARPRSRIARQGGGRV